MVQVIPVAGAESPLYQALRGIMSGVEQGRQLKEAQRLRERQKLEDQRRRTSEDFSQQVGIANLIREAALGTSLADAPHEQLDTPAAGVPPLLQKLSEILSTGTPETPVMMQPPVTSAPPVDVAAMTAVPGVVPVPAPVPSQTKPTTPVKRGFKIKSPDGREISVPLQYKEEAEAEKVRLAEQQKELMADTMDVPDMPELFGKLSGQKKVRTSVVNAVTQAQSRRDVAAETAEAKAAAEKEKQAGKDKAATDEALTIEAEARNWVEGRTQPRTGEIQSKAAAHIAANPEKYPGGSPKYLTAKQWEEVTATRVSLDTLEDIVDSYDKVKRKLGPIKFGWNEAKQKIPGLAADPDFTEFQRLLRGAQNIEVKRITGAQMSEQEAQRLIKGMADGSLKPADFEAAMKIWRRNAERNMAALQGRKLPKMGAAAEKPKTMDDLLKQYGYDKK